MVTKNEVDINMYVRLKAHEISNQSIHTSWNLQTDVKIKEVLKEKAITFM